MRDITSSEQKILDRACITLLFLGLAFVFGSRLTANYLLDLNPICEPVSRLKYWPFPRAGADVLSCGFDLGNIFLMACGVVVALGISRQIWPRKIDSENFRSGGISRYIAAFVMIIFLSGMAGFYVYLVVVDGFGMFERAYHNLFFLSMLEVSFFPLIISVLFILRAVFSSFKV